jgi:hypothetical protein
MALRADVEKGIEELLAFDKFVIYTSFSQPR